MPFGSVTVAKISKKAFGSKLTPGRYNTQQAVVQRLLESQTRQCGWNKRRLDTKLTNCRADSLAPMNQAPMNQPIMQDTNPISMDMER